MKPRGQRLACSLKTVDGCVGSYDVFPGPAAKSIARADPVKWDRQPQRGVREAMFSIIGAMGMTGHMNRANQDQWRALTQVKLEQPVYASIPWARNPLN